MTWLDYGYEPRPAKKPILRGVDIRLADLRPTHPTIRPAQWEKQLPREAWVQPEDIKTLFADRARAAATAAAKKGRK